MEAHLKQGTGNPFQSFGLWLWYKHNCLKSNQPRQQSKSQEEEDLICCSLEIHMPSALWFCILEAARGSRKLYALSHVWPARANLVQLTDFDLQQYIT